MLQLARTHYSLSSSWFTHSLTHLTHSLTHSLFGSVTVSSAAVVTSFVVAYSLLLVSLISLLFAADFGCVDILRANGFSTGLTIALARRVVGVTALTGVASPPFLLVIGFWMYSLIVEGRDWNSTDVSP